MYYSTRKEEFPAVIHNTDLRLLWCRRNLTDSLREYFRGKLYESRKKREGGSGTNQYTKVELAQNDPVPNEKDNYLSSETHDQFCITNNHNLQVKKSTAEIIAKEQKVSPATVKRSYQYSQAIDTIGNTCGEEIKQKILKEEIRVTKEEVIPLLQKFYSLSWVTAPI